MTAYTAAQWRPMLRQETARYANTPGGAPPWQIAEGMIDLESGGDPSNVTDVGNGDVAVGLGQITTRGLEYDLYRKRFPNGPTDLTDPQTNLRVMILGLDSRQEMGVEAAKHNQPHALSNWLVTAAAYFGAGSNEGINTKSDRFGTTGDTYVAHITAYMRDVLRLSNTQIAAIAGGENTGESLEPGGPSAPSPEPSSGGGIGGFLLDGLKRAVPGLAGLALLIAGAFMVMRNG